MDEIVEWANTPEKKVGLAIAAVALLFLAIQYPKVSVPVGMASATVIPSAIYQLQDDPQYFVITQGTGAVDMQIPTMDAETIRANDKTLHELRLELDG